MHRVQLGDENRDSEFPTGSQEASAAEPQPPPARARLSSASSTNWENARYRRRSGSFTSLNSTTTAMQAAPAPIGAAAPYRPLNNRMQAPPPRPILKNGRAPSSQVMAYHFKNGSTGHVNTPSHYQRYQPTSHSVYRQPHYRKSASQTSIIRSSMYGQYGTYDSPSRKSSVVSFDYASEDNHRAAPERRSSRQFQQPAAYAQHGAYGELVNRNTQSSYSLDLPQMSTSDMLEHRYPRRYQYSGDYNHNNYNDYNDYFSRETSGGGDVSRRTSIRSQSSFTHDTHAYTQPDRRQSSREPNRQPSSVISHASGRTSSTPRRPLPPQPPVLPLPDFNSGWPPSGWQVYVSAMTHDYLYGNELMDTRPPLDDYVFDQDTLTFVKPRVANGEPLDSASSFAHDSRMRAPPAGAAGPAFGRGTQSLDLPREYQSGRDLAFGPAYPKAAGVQGNGVAGDVHDQHKDKIRQKQEKQDKKSATLKKNSLKSPKTKSSKKVDKSNSAPASPKENVEDSHALLTPPPSATTTTAPTVPTTPTSTAASSSNLFSFLKSPSSVSLSSKKSTKSKNGSGGWPWRKRTRSVSGSAQVLDGADIPPPVPALPPNIVNQSPTRGTVTGGEVRVNLKEKVKEDEENVSGNGNEDAASVDHRSSGHASMPAAFRDASVQHDWSVQAQPLSTYSDSLRNSGTESPSGSRKGAEKKEENGSESGKANGSGVDSSSDQDDNNADITPTESDPSSNQYHGTKAKMKLNGGYPSPPSSATGHQPRPQHRRTVSSDTARDSPPPRPARRDTTSSTRTAKASIVDHALSPSPYPTPAAPPSSAGSTDKEHKPKHYYGFKQKRGSGYGPPRSSSVMGPAPATPVLAQLQWDARSMSSVALSTSNSDWSTSVGSGRPESSMSARPHGGSGHGHGSALGHGYYGSTATSPSPSRPPSSMSNTTATTSATATRHTSQPHYKRRSVGNGSGTAAAAPYISYMPSTPSNGSIDALATAGAMGRAVGKGNSSEEAAPSPTPAAAYASGVASPVSTSPPSPPSPVKMKGWRRWTSPLSSRRASVDETHADKGTKTAVQVRPSIALDRMEGAGSALGEMGESPALIWSAPTPVPGLSSKLRKKRK